MHICRWSKIASHFPGRTDNEIKNLWNCKIKKKLTLLGLAEDPKKLHQEETDLNSTKSSGEEVNKCSPKAVRDSSTPNLGPRQTHILESENGNDMSCGSSENDNLIRSTDHSDAASLTSTILQADSSINISTSTTFLEGMLLDEYCNSAFPENDFGNWMESLEAFLSWESCNNLEDIFLRR